MPIKQIPREIRGITYVQEFEPSSPQIGDSWFDTFFSEVRFWNGNIWILLGQPAL